MSAALWCVLGLVAGFLIGALLTMWAVSPYLGRRVRLRTYQRPRTENGQQKLADEMADDLYEDAI